MIPQRICARNAEVLLKVVANNLIVIHHCIQSIHYNALPNKSYRNEISRLTKLISLFGKRSPNLSIASFDTCS